MQLKVGQSAPNFVLPAYITGSGKSKTEDGKEELLALSDYAGKWLLIYFYPKDATPGCTKEACTLQESLPQFDKLGIAVLGVSADTIESHKKFATKYKLKFPLIADVDKELVEAYGVWGKKKFLGREYMGIKRDSYLINPKGKIAKIYREVKPEEHAREVLADIEALKQNL